MSCDFCMCLNTTCEKRNDCYRFRMWPGDFQTCASFKPNTSGGKFTCEHFCILHKGDVVADFTGKRMMIVT